ncbi:MAG: hypothetical protein IKY96_00835 [Oscillospiraceae bacterium]|nr:hypothetical protein [Oscillospiraceae bacterium]
MYPAMKPKRLTGNEALVAPDGNKVSCLIDFWRWAYSDLVGNAERGALAEYIVACALEISDTERISWDKYDLLTKEGISVEVKTSGYLQTWEQKSLSKPVFGIQPTYGWDSKTNEFGMEQKRQSDIYVFCVHKHTEQDTVDPLRISQWEFYLLPTGVLNEKCGNQKTITLSALKKIGAQACAYGDLKKRVFEIVMGVK